MKQVLAGCAIALCMGSAAMASDQLARQLGVQPGVYTLSELVAIKALEEDHEPLRLKWAIESAGRDVVVSTQSIAPTRRMNDQLGRNIRVDPSDYSLSELVAKFLDETS